MNDVTRILSAIEQGDPQAAEQLLPLVYDELRRLAARRLAREAPGQTLQATALVHEAYLRLVDGEPDRHWNGRGHFFAAAAEAMRRILVENARRKRRLKRGGGRRRVELDRGGPRGRRTAPDELLALDEALDRLAGEDPAGRRAGQAPLLRRADRRAGRRGPRASRRERPTGIWAYARAWLFRSLGGEARTGLSPEILRPRWQ